jgi:hypothetical protein
MAPPQCRRCRGVGWVCEEHPNKAWTGPKSCQCGAAGMPCPSCCMDADWNADPERAQDVSRVLGSLLHIAGKEGH